MAKIAGVNKAAKIREYFQAHPNAKGVDVVTALAKDGVKVTAAQVSNVKTTLSKKTKSDKTAGRHALKKARLAPSTLLSWRDNSIKLQELQKMPWRSLMSSTGTWWPISGGGELSSRVPAHPTGFEQSSTPTVTFAKSTMKHFDRLGVSHRSGF